MGRVVDALSTMHRLLILISATLLVVSVGLRDDPFPATNQLRELALVERSYNQLLYVLRRRAAEHYHPQLMQAADTGSAWLKDVSKRASFVPGHILMRSQTDELLIGTNQAVVTLGQMKWMVHSAGWSASYPVYDLDFTTLEQALLEIDRDRQALYEAQDLEVTVWPLVDKPQCNISFSSKEREQLGEPGWWFDVPCIKRREPVDVTESVEGLLSLNGLLNRKYLGIWPKADKLTYLTGKAQIELLSRGELSRSEEVDLLGFKISSRQLANIGPMIIIFVLIAMIGSHGQIRERTNRDDIDAIFWLGMFRGWRMIGMIVTACCLPTLATATALSAIYQPPESRASVTGSYNFELFWSERYFIGGTLLVLGLSVWFVLTGRRAAQAGGPATPAATPPPAAPAPPDDAPPPCRTPA